MPFPLPEAERVIRDALTEDVGAGDVTTRACVPTGTRATAALVAKQPLTLAGIDGFVRVFELLSSRHPVEWTLHYQDGDAVPDGATVAEGVGDARVLLTGERTALNLLQHLCGIATRTAAWSRHLAGTRARLVDTRKTLPGLRALEKYAVRAGGGANHRFGLFDGILIKENHIRAAGSIASAVSAARAHAPHLLRVEVEVSDLPAFDEALEAKADIVLLDNMSTEAMRACVERCKGRALLEASGNVTEERLKEIAETGVDLISCGALTHSAPSADLSLLFA